MYPGAVNSPETFLTAEVSETDTIIGVDNAGELADIPLPFLLVLGGSVIHAETVRVTAISGNNLTVERGYQGAAQAWEENTVAGVNFTEAHYRALVNNIEALYSVQPTAKIKTIPITPSDYYTGVWELFLCEGGISSPLEAWGFTNATLTTLQHRIAIDINTNTATLYAPPQFAGLTWNVYEYQSGVYILSAGNIALILIRR